MGCSPHPLSPADPEPSSTQPHCSTAFRAGSTRRPARLPGRTPALLSSRRDLSDNRLAALPLGGLGSLTHLKLQGNPALSEPFAEDSFPKLRYCLHPRPRLLFPFPLSMQSLLVSVSQPPTVLVYPMLSRPTDCLWAGFSLYGGAEGAHHCGVMWVCTLSHAESLSEVVLQCDRRMTDWLLMRGNSVQSAQQ